MAIKAAGGAKKDNLITFLFHLEDHIFIFFLQGMAVVTVGTKARGRGRLVERGGWRGSPRMRPTRRSTEGTGGRHAKSTSLWKTENISWHHRKSKSLWKTEIISSGPPSQRTSCMSSSVLLKSLIILMFTGKKTLHCL